MRDLVAIAAREARLAWAGGGGAAGPAAFFLAALTLAPLAMGADPQLLSQAGPGIMAFLALLSVLQSAERLHGEDLSDGTLDLYALAPSGLVAISLAKTLGHGFATLWPLPFIGILGGIMFGVPIMAALLLGLGLLAALPGLVMIAGFAGALGAGIKRAGFLIALIAAPLMVPILVFAAGTGRAALDNNPDQAFATVMVTAALSLGSLALFPFAMAAALRARIS